VTRPARSADLAAVTAARADDAIFLSPSLFLLRSGFCGLLASSPLSFLGLVRVVDRYGSLDGWA
jgi:hypothetical protein